ncbi:MAG: Pept protein, partial [Acidobacteriota bacterium]|nr:Pept protein [Acidobacteriota bacterium]
EAQCMQFRGYLIVGDQLNDLPAGSTLDTQRGIFYWQPGPGFFGEYQLLFMIESQDGYMAYKGIKIKITPKL